MSAQSNAKAFQNQNLTNSGQPTLFLTSTNTNGVFGQQSQPVMLPQSNQMQVNNKTGFIWPSPQEQAKQQQLSWNAPQGTNPFGQVQTNKAVTFPQLQPFGVQQQQQPNIFGQQQQQPSIFGQQQQQPSIFGQQQQQPNIFGQQQQQPSIFGQQQQQPNIFGQQPSIFGQQQQPNIFGQQQQQPSIFGQQQQQPSIFGQQQQQPSIFGQQQQQPSIFGQQQLQPNIFGQQQQKPNIFGQQPSIFGQQQQQPNIFGQQQQQPNIFGQQQQQPSVFGQQQQPSSVFGQQQQPSSVFGQQQQPIAFVQQQQQPIIYGLPPQVGQHFAFTPTGQPFQQLPPQFYESVPQQFFLTQVVDQNGQVSVIPVPCNVLDNVPQPTGNAPSQIDWKQIGMLPAATLNSAVTGRGPSLFSTDPSFDSPLYTWKRNNVNWRRYPDGLNPSVASTFVDPPGLWTLPSAASYFPKYAPAKDRHYFMDRSRPDHNSLFEERDFAFQHWTNALKKSPSNESVKKSPFLENTERYQRFKLAFDNNDNIFGKYPEGSFSSPLRRDDDDPKRLSPQLVRAMESLSEPRKKYSLNNSPYKLGQRFVKEEDKYWSSPKPNIELVTSSSNKESPGSRRPLGLFDQPIHGDIPRFLKTPTPGPPKDNAFQYCAQDPWRTRQEIYKQLVEESHPPDYKARLPKTVNRTQTPSDSGEFSRAKTRIWNDPMNNPMTVRSAAHTVRMRNPQSSRPPVITLTRKGYYCIPDLPRLGLMQNIKGQCSVEDFEVGHESFGKIVFPGTTNVTGLNLDKIIFFEHKEICIYPDGKPPYGEGLHRPAIVTLFEVWPVLKDTGAVVRDPETLRELQYERLLRKACKRCDGKFISYDPRRGMWTFKIQVPEGG